MTMTRIVKHLDVIEDIQPNLFPVNVNSSRNTFTLELVFPQFNGYTLTCDEIDKVPKFKSATKSSASIQFESRDSSLQGNFYVLSDDGDLGTDHLTGG